MRPLDFNIIFQLPANFYLLIVTYSGELLKKILVEVENTNKQFNEILETLEKQFHDFQESEGNAGGGARISKRKPSRAVRVCMFLYVSVNVYDSQLWCATNRMLLGKYINRSVRMMRTLDGSRRKSYGIICMLHSLSVLKSSW